LPVRKNTKAAARRLSIASCAPSTSRDNTSSHGVDPASCTPSRSFSKLVSPELHRFAKRTKCFKLRRASLPVFPVPKTSPLFRKASDISSPEAIAKCR
ncbi:hypothetical protein OESDEN_12696, partial [Oesophagostomum dentatum]